MPNLYIFGKYIVLLGVNNAQTIRDANNTENTMTQARFYAALYFLMAYHQLKGKRVYLFTQNSNQLDPFASELVL